jgi:hypothetical protein
MANTPNIKSYEQLLGEMNRTYTSKIGVDDQNVGSANLCFFETVAQAIYRAQGSVLNILRDQDVDRATGEVLRKKAADEKVTIKGSTVGTGTVTVTDTSFSKISTKIYAGGKPVMIGATTIYVSDASNFPTSGQLYIGRGTNNFEGPISFTAVTQIGSYYSITLATQTTKYHNLSEPVVLAQGGVRQIPSGTIVKASSSGVDISFSVTTSYSILDGEVSVTGVPIVSQEPGTKVNVPAGAIKTFGSIPFSGATVINESPVDNATDEDTEEEIRINIKRAIASRGKGTDLAIKTACLGATSSDDSSTVTSNEIVRGTSTVLYVDNGNGYEEKQKGVGIEYLVDSALGGEESFQLATGGNQTSVAKAFVESTNSSPFNLYGQYKLAVLVGDVLSEHIFVSSDFATEGSVSAYEICSSINENSGLLFYATTSNDGANVVIKAKSESYDYIQVTTPETGTDANSFINFPTGQVRTLNLYKNKKLLSKDGKKASVYSENQSLWSSLISSGETLILKVDNTQFITYTITDADFISEGTHTSVSSTNTLASWVNVFNSKLIGVTASYSGTSITLSSNLGYSDRAAIEIDSGSTLVSKGVFTSDNGLLSSGESSDYVLSRNTAQITLVSPLVSGDSLTLGTEYNRGLVSSSSISGGSISFSNNAELWVSIDDKTAEIVQHGLSSGALVNVTKNSGKLRFATSSASAFSNVKQGDRMILWSRDFNSANRGEWLVSSATGSYVEVVLTSTEYSSAVLEAVTFSTGLSFFRGEKIQKITIPTGAYTTVLLANDVNSKIIGGQCYSQDDEFLVIETNNRDSSYGRVMIAAQNDIAQTIGFSLGSSSFTESGHIAFKTSSQTEIFPTFQQGVVTSDAFANPTESYVSSISVSPSISNKNDVVNITKSFDNTPTTMEGEAQISSVSGTTINLRDSDFIRRVLAGDRYFVTSPLSFSHNDSLVSILDSDASNNTFSLPMYRKVKVNSTKPEDVSGFRCFDLDAGETSRLVDNFSGVSFNDYKAMMKARVVLDNNSVSEDALLFRSSVYGKSGEFYKIGYKYPSSANAEISHSVEVADTVKMLISLKSGDSFNSGHNGTTVWDVAVASNTPSVGLERVTFTYLSGQAVDFGSLDIGDYVTINSKTGFNASNLGTFKISDHVNTSFSVDRKLGSAVAETLVQTLVTEGLQFFRRADTKASEINDYVNANMTDFVSSEILDDGGVTGNGLVEYSTHQLSGWAFDSVQFVDGENYIASTTLNAVAPSPELTFKIPLTLHSINSLYNFTNGETFFLVPTTHKHVVDFCNVLAVTGISTVSSVELADKNSQISIASKEFGSGGGVQIVDGTANSLQTAIRGNSSVPSTGLMMSSVDSADGAFLSSGMFVKIQAQNYQKKQIGISYSTQAQILETTPSYGYSKITLSNRQVRERFFGTCYTFPTVEDSEFIVERQGKLTCFSYTGNGQDPTFSKTISLGNVAKTADVSFDSSTDLAKITVDVGFFTHCTIGDSILIGSPFNSLNQGTFVIEGISDTYDSIYFSNENVIAESFVSLSSSVIDLYLGLKEGDFVEIDSPFNVLNRGKFRIIRVVGNCFYIENNKSLEEKVVASSSNVDFGVSLGVSRGVVENSGSMRFGPVGTSSLFVPKNLKIGDFYTFGNEFSVGNRGTFCVSRINSDYVEFKNKDTVLDMSPYVVISTNKYAKRPAMKFFPAESLMSGDKVVISSNVLGDSNNGTFTVIDSYGQNEAILSGVLASNGPVNLLDQKDYLYIEEKELFCGYKKILTTCVDPGDSTLVKVIFDTNKNYEKVNEMSGCLIDVQSKLGFVASSVKGTDSYYYNTGLVAECNKIIYGDPRDNITYSGVGAAGAEIFVRAPLVKRIQVAISIRAKTGVPFSYLTEKVRSTVYSVINSSPIGQSIAISSIISAVNSVQGVSAVSISSPQYSVTNDMITVSAHQKPKVLDIVNDIVISKVG